MLTPTVKRAAQVAIAALFVLVVAGCGGGGDDAAPPPPPPAGNVGPAGATVTSPDNKASLDVPAGALSSTINVTLTPASDGFQSDPQIVPGTVYKLDAPEMGLAQDATLALSVPASAASGASGSLDRAQTLAAQGRAHTESVLLSFGLIGCEGFPVLGANVDLPPGITCVYDASLWPLCPPTAPVIVGHDDDYVSRYFGPGATGEGAAGAAIFCQAAPPTPQIALLSPTLAAALLPTVWNKASLVVSTKVHILSPAIFGVFIDNVAPSIHLTAVVTPVGNGLATLKLAADASDNVGVANVTFQQVKPVITNLTGPYVNTQLATFVAGPYTWESAPLPLNEIYNATYGATVFDTGHLAGFDHVDLVQGAPTISSFTASPPTVPFGGADVTLSWASANANTLVIDQGVGDVTGVTSKTVHVTSTTSFKLTSTNTEGTVSASLTVVVGPQPAATISAFAATPPTLPAGGGNVVLTWATSDANSLSITPGVGDVTGLTSKTVNNVTANTTFTLTAANPNGSATRQASVVVATTGDRFVDVASGSDANNCLQASPCRTIAKAMTGAPSGSTIYLADGTYGSATQSAVTIPDGVTLRATNAGAAILTNVAVTAAGSAVINGVVLDQENNACASIAANGSSGAPTLVLTGVLIKCMGAVNIGGNVNATMTPGALPGGIYTAALPGSFGAILSVGGTGQLLIQGGVVDGNNTGAAVFGAGLMAVSGQGKLTLSGVSVRNRTGVGFVNHDSGAIVLKNGTLIDNVGTAGNCASAAVIVMNDTGSLTMDHSQISNSSSAGVCVRSGTSVSTIALTQSTITGTAAAIASETGGSPAAATITADGMSLTNNGYGIDWFSASGSSIDMKNSIVTGNGTGIQVSGSSVSLKLRSSNVSNNTDSGVAVFASVTADLGTQADPGGNTFTGNVTQGIKINLADGQTAQAVGNTWNANQQGADASGHYSVAPSWVPVPKTGPAAGKNYGISGAVMLDL